MLDFSQIMVAFAPFSLVWIMGFAMAVTRLKAFHKPKILIVIGCSLIGISQFIFMVVVLYVIPYYMSSGIGTGETVRFIGLILWSSSIAIGVGLLMWAAFAGRKTVLQSDE